MSNYKKLKEKQNREFDKRFCPNNIFHMVAKPLDVKEFIDKVRKETIEYERKRIKKEIEKINIASKFMNTIDRDKVLNIFNNLE